MTSRSIFFVADEHSFCLSTFPTHFSWLCTGPRPQLTVYFVAPALPKMEEKTTQPLTPDRVLEKFYGRLFKAIHSPELLAAFMLSRQLIGAEIVNDLTSMTCSQGKVKLLSAFIASLQGSQRQESVMERMCLAMEDTGEPGLAEVASDIRTLYQGWFCGCALAKGPKRA